MSQRAVAHEPPATFRDRLDEWTNRRFHTSVGKLPGTEQSKKMILFYLEEVLLHTDPQLAPEDSDDLQEGIVDQPGERGIDFICRQDNKVFIAQCKYRSKKARAEPAEFSHFRSVLGRLYRPSDWAMPERLREVVQDIDWEDDRFELHFLTLARANDEMRHAEQGGVEAIPELPDLLDRVDLVLLDETDLNRKLRDALSATESLNVPIQVRFMPNEDQEPWLRFEHEGRVSYVGRVSGSQLYELYRPNERKNRLFWLNIRHYVGSTDTNKGIERTALSGPEDFFFFNNGISAVATNIEEDRAQSMLTCQRFSIVNGAQTVRSIYRAGLRPEAAEALRRLQVLLRISEVSNKRTQKEEEFLGGITRYNNTQNEIKISDFRSNDLVQRQLKEYFGRLCYRGKYVLYRAKRSAEPERNCHVVRMEEFTKTVFAFQFGPDDMHGGNKYLFDPGPEGGYRQIFGEAGAETTLDQDEFSRLAGIWSVCAEARTVWKTEKQACQGDAEAKGAVERRWMVYFSLGEVLRQAYSRAGKHLDSDLKALGRLDWLDREEPERSNVHLFVKLACRVLIDGYKAANKDPSFTHRNWFRSKETLSTLRSSVTHHLETLTLFAPHVLPTLRSRPGG